MKLFLNNGNEHVGRHGAPDLRLHCFLAVAQKLLDTQLLLDPFEEQLDVPAAFVQAAMVNGGKLVLLVKKTKVSWVRGKLVHGTNSTI